MSNKYEIFKKFFWKAASIKMGIQYAHNEYMYVEPYWIEMDKG